MSQSLADWFAELRTPLVVPDFEPDIDDKDAAKDAQLREEDAIHSGLIRKAVLREGRSDAAQPVDGDLVYVHYNVRTADGTLLQSTWPKEGGSGVPLPFIIGKGARVPRSWELALTNATVGEVFRVVSHHSYAYGHKDCKLPAPKGVPPGQELTFQLELLQCYSKDDVQLLPEQEGLFKRSISRGEVWETPRPPFEVTVSVKARLPAGDGSHRSVQPFFETPAEQPLHFTLGSGVLPSAVEEGLAAMTKGETAIISASRAAAAAPGSEPLIPAPPATAERVEYELTLHTMIQVRDMTGDGQVVKRRIKDGRGEFPVDCPIEDSAVHIHYRCMDAESGAAVLDTRGEDATAPAFEYQTGMGMVPEGLDMAVRLMTPGEVAHVTSTSVYAYDGRPDRPEGLAEGASVKWEVELIDFDRQAHPTQLGRQRLVERATQLKEQGNAVFKQDMVTHATTKWLKALKVLNSIFDIDTEQQRQEVDALKASCMVNLALASQRQENCSEALTWAGKALKEVPDHPKALYRRAAVRAFLGQLDEAEADFRRVAEVDPAAAAEAKQQIVKMRQKDAAAKQKQKSQWKNFFG